MARHPIPPGGWGAITVRPAGEDAVTVQARYRGLDGKLHRFRVRAPDEASGRAKLLAAAERIDPLLESRALLSTADLTPGATVAELAAYWLALEEAEERVQASTREKAAQQVRKYVIPHFGFLRLNELTVGRVDRTVMTLRARFSAPIAYRTRSVLSQMLDLAATYDLVPTNVARQSRRVARPQRDIAALSLEDLSLVRSELERWTEQGSPSGPHRSPQLRRMVEVAIGTGMRIGEIVALRPMHVDLERRTLLVAATCTYSVAEGYSIQEHPKRETQRRTISLPTFAVDVLAAAIDTSLPATTTVFHSRRQTPLWTNNVQRQLRQFVRDTDIEARLDSVSPGDLTMHTFRRTVGTHLARAAGTDAARDQLGHSEVATTERSYAKRSGVVAPGIADSLQELFG